MKKEEEGGKEPQQERSDSANFEKPGCRVHWSCLPPPLSIHRSKGMIAQLAPPFPFFSFLQKIQFFSRACVGKWSAPFFFFLSRKSEALMDNFSPSLSSYTPKFLSTWAGGRNTHTVRGGAEKRDLGEGVGGKHFGMPTTTSNAEFPSNFPLLRLRENKYEIVYLVGENACGQRGGKGGEYGF